MKWWAWARGRSVQIRFIVPQKGSVATPLRLTAYLLWPGAEWGFTGGIPLGQAGVLALAAVWIIWAFGLRSAGWPIAATLVVLKMASARCWWSGDWLILPFYVLILPYPAVAAAALLPHDIP